MSLFKYIVIYKSDWYILVFCESFVLVISDSNVSVRGMDFNPTFYNISEYRGSQFNWWRNPEKTIDLPQVSDKNLLHNIVQSLF
jgi:hypothetical protein